MQNFIVWGLFCMSGIPFTRGVDQTFLTFLKFISWMVSTDLDIIIMFEVQNCLDHHNLHVCLHLV